MTFFNFLAFHIATSSSSQYIYICMRRVMCLLHFSSCRNYVLKETCSHLDLCGGGGETGLCVLRIVPMHREIIITTSTIRFSANDIARYQLIRKINIKLYNNNNNWTVFYNSRIRMWNNKSNYNDLTPKWTNKNYRWRKNAVNKPMKREGWNRLDNGREKQKFGLYENASWDKWSWIHHKLISR